MLISVSGKINSGKDTIGQIIKIILDNPHLNNEGILNFMKKEVYNNEESPYYSSWQIKKFADKLKDIVCLLLGCTREQLEDREFKEKELGEEWWKYKYWNGNDYSICNYLDYQERFHINNESNITTPILIKMTPRLLLQLLGTECGRNIIHPNLWVLALMADYKATTQTRNSIGGWDDTDFPNWIITDTRFPNELKAVKDREGITIRVNRNPENKWIDKQEWDLHTKGIVPHESETALDNAEFDYTITNDGSIKDLINKVKQILEIINKNNEIF